MTVCANGLPVRFRHTIKSRVVALTDRQRRMVVKEKASWSLLSPRVTAFTSYLVRAPVSSTVRHVPEQPSCLIGSVLQLSSNPRHQFDLSNFLKTTVPKAPHQRGLL
jgi:hypothetical protein